MAESVEETVEVRNDMKRGIKQKMLLGIMIPTAGILITIAIVLLAVVKDSVSEIRTQEISAESSQVSGQIREYFTKYMEVTKQMAANQELRVMLSELKQNEKIEHADKFDSVRKTMTNVRHTDDENILVTWLADADSSQCIEDEESGYVSVIGEWDITSRDWYEPVIKSGSTIVTEPYQNSSTGEMVSSIITPIYDDAGAFEGVAAVDISVSTLENMMSQQKLGKEGYFILLSPKGNILYAPDSSILHTSFTSLSLDQKVIQAFQAQEDSNFAYRWNGEKRYGCFKTIGSTGWSVLSGMSDSEYNGALYRLWRILTSFFLAAILLLTIVIRILSGGIIKPLKCLKETAEQIADGDLNVEISVSTGDEVEAVALALEKTVNRLKNYMNYIKEITEILNKIADGTITFQLKQDYAGEFSVIKTALENLAAKLTKTLHNINETSIQVSGGAEQIANGAQSLAEGATSQANAVDELKITVSEIAEKVIDNASSAEDAAEKIVDMSRELEFSNQQMEHAVSAMNEIHNCSNEIEHIITTIEEIADQTSLLSLNASVEAARAGEMGRGFGVVAGQVSNLAGESMQAVQTTSQLIHHSMEAVKNGMNIVDGAAGQMMQALAHINSLKELVQKVNEVSKVQQDGINRIKQAVEQISEVISDNSAMAEESAAASEELSAQSQNLTELIQTFQID